MKLSVGFVGVLIVLFAVVSSICFLNLLGVTATLIIIEVVPFLVLAVGVDNLFIMVHSYEVRGWGGCGGGGACLLVVQVLTLCVLSVCVCSVR